MIECRKQTKMETILIKSNCAEAYTSRKNARFMKKLMLVNSKTFSMIHFPMRSWINQIYLTILNNQ